MQIDCAMPVVVTSSSAVDVQEVSDETLVRSIAGGDQRALQVLFGRHNVKTFHFVLRLVQDAPLAEELVSDVFFDVWRQADKFQSRSQVTTWLLAIARNKAIATLRRRRSDQLEDDVLELLQDPADDPKLTILKKQRISLVLPCLMQLSNEHGEIIDLVYYHGQSIDEVAQILGVPRNTVKTRMFYARNRMEQLLAKVGVHTASLH
jgi:RNA polymerase sigma-70 factor (ECF subfamily)